MNLLDPNDYLDPTAQEAHHAQLRLEAVVDAATTWATTSPRHRRDKARAWAQLAQAVDRLEADQARQADGIVALAVEAVTANASAFQAARERPDGRKVGATHRVATAARLAKDHLEAAVVNDWSDL